MKTNGHMLAKALLCVLVIAYIGSTSACAENLLKNPSFEQWEQGKPVGWTWWEKRKGDGPVQAGLELSKDIVSSGKRCVRLWKKTPYEGDRHATLYQNLTGLPAGAKLNIKARVKGSNVGDVRWGYYTTQGPTGDFDWHTFSFILQLKPDQTETWIAIAFLGVTENLWVDDLEVTIDSGEKDIPPADADKWLVIRRLDDMTEEDTGFEMIVRNPLKQATRVSLNWILSDGFNSEIEQKSMDLELSAGSEKKLAVPVAKDRRVAYIYATVADSDGEFLQSAADDVALEPATLTPIEGSKRFGFDVYVPPNVDRFFDLLTATGLRGHRYPQMDRSYDHKRKTIDPNAMKWYLSAMQSRGMELLPILYSTPQWASSAPADATAHQKRCSMPDLEVWAELCRLFVKAHNFKAVEVWNEPDMGFWQTFPKPQTYAKLLNASYKAVKEVDPNIIVVGMGGLTHLYFMEDVFKAGGKCDAVSIHPYRERADNSHRGLSIEKPLAIDESYPQLMARLNALTAKYNSGKPLPVYVTEVGFGKPEGNIHRQQHYRYQHVIRTYLTLAGLGVARTQFHTFRLSSYDWGVCLRRPGDDVLTMIIKPGWWAARALGKAASARTIGRFAPLSDDVYGLTMSGETNAVAVWTAENPAIIGTSKQILEARGIYGREVSSLPTETGRAYVIPAGSVLYLTGDSDFGTSDLDVLMQLRADQWRAISGGTVTYSVETTEACERYFGGSISKTVSLKIDPSMEQWAGGTLKVSAGNKTLKVPVIVPVREKFRLAMRFDEQCHPEVRLENNAVTELEAEISFVYGPRVRNKVKIAPGATHREKQYALPGDPAKPMKVKAQVNIGDKEFTLWQLLYYARVGTAAIEIDSKTDDWKDVERITLSEWTSSPRGGPFSRPGPEDLSAGMALAYDENNLYVLVEVTDDEHYQPNFGGNMWHADSVQISIDTNPTGEHSRVEVGFCKNDNGQISAHCWQLNVLDVSQIRRAIKRTGNRVVYELALPLAIFNVVGKPGTRLGFSILVNESDGGAREGWLRWSAGIGMTKDPEKHAQIIFGN